MDRQIAKWRTVLTALLLAGSLGLPAAAVELSERHRESQLNTEFRFSEMPFHEYVNHMRLVIGKTRVDLTPENRLAVIDANSPFEWRPPARECRKPGERRFRNGALLIHGLSDSPYLMRDVAQYLHRRCFLVRAILLPGHGTVPGDLLEVHHLQWIKATRYGIDSFLAGKDVDRLFLVGFSTGAALAILHGAQDEPVSGLVLFSPAVRIKSNLGFMANWPKALGWAAPTKLWLDLAADDDFAKYESFTFNAADQIYLLTQRLGSALKDDKQLRMPMFMALSADDATVDAGDAVAFFKSQKHPDHRLVLYTNSHADPGDLRIERRASAYPQEGILNFSHLGILVSPDNPHYGRSGDYKNCLHYLDDPARREACKSGGNGVRVGEVTDENLKQATLRRLTFNPDYDRLMGDMEAFMARIP